MFRDRASAHQSSKLKATAQSTKQLAIIHGYCPRRLTGPGRSCQIKSCQYSSPPLTGDYSISQAPRPFIQIAPVILLPSGPTQRRVAVLYRAAGTSKLAVLPQTPLLPCSQGGQLKLRANQKDNISIRSVLREIAIQPVDKTSMLTPCSSRQSKTSLCLIHQNDKSNSSTCQTIPIPRFALFFQKPNVRVARVTLSSHPRMVYAPPDLMAAPTQCWYACGR
ncbi:hypothetical protein B0I35DRAFT_102638 [Stachybotrys elegans]|uniref:Uncharacterized protein n=1 Tax=Stachybotrys elegans TaxID=80388 RepID=A0A8K0SHS9_9HYPO|nr:hypothetical protein B0I35DRAFT_102638 [Stachybotrys elegans]